MKRHYSIIVAVIVTIIACIIVFNKYTVLQETKKTTKLREEISKIKKDIVFNKLHFEKTNDSSYYVKYTFDEAIIIDMQRNLDSLSSK